MANLLGVDEVGRGAWAGPLVVGACYLNQANIPGLTDSKRLTKKQRAELNQQILASSAIVGLGWVWAKEIDDIGLSAGLKLATRRAVTEVEKQCQEKSVSFEEIIIDGTVNFLIGTELEDLVTVIKKADLLIPSVSAAAIHAKVSRDSYMQQLSKDEELRHYYFDKHVGYGTKVHQEKLTEYGVSPEHRVSFKPVLNAKQTGDKAELKVAQMLEGEGHNVIERNWRTRWCEIDIISTSADKIYFTEVKYRRNNDFGGAAQSISKHKLKQMKFAAEIYIQKNELQVNDMCLCGAFVEGDKFKITDWFEIN